jgi:hypothetical protein
MPTDHLTDEQIATNGRALHVLAGLEAETSDVLGSSPELAERARRFEKSLVANAADHGLIEVVRASLAFGARPSGPAAPDVHSDGQSTADALYAFQAFRRRPELASLARALMKMRGMVPALLRGAVPLRALSPWVRYLRGASHNFADARDIAPKEALSWAHFCLHSMNVCELAAQEGQLTDATRSSLKDVEDELKEFAMAAQRDADKRQPDGGMSNLGRYDRMRWRPRGDVEYLADRTARLAGGWRAPSRRTPVGSPTELTSNLVDRAESLFADALSDEDSDHTARKFAEALQHCRISGAEWLENVDLEMIARLVAFGYRCARDLPGVSVGSGFCLDFGDVRPKDGQATDLRALDALLSRHSLQQLLSDEARPPDHTLGLVGALDTSDDGAPTVQLQLELNGELRALLQLIDEQADDAGDPELQSHIERRIDDLLEGEGAGQPADSNRHSSDTRSPANR